MSRKNLSHVCALAIVALVGCGQDTSGPQSTKTPARTAKVYTRAELDKLVAPGMSAGDITNMFGNPDSVTRIEGSVLTLMYTFPTATFVQEGGPRLTGFDVHTRDGKVVAWSPIMGQAHKMFQNPGETQSASGEKTFQIFLVVGPLTNIVKAIAVEGSADAKVLDGAADLEVKGKVFGGVDGSERSGEQSVILVVSEADASKLKDLAVNNSGKRMLIVYQNLVVAAPTITDSLRGRQLRFTVQNSGILDRLERL